MTGTGYDDARAHLLDEMRRIDLLLRRYVDDWRVETATGDSGVTGLYVADEEVDRILRPDRDRPPASEQFRDRIAELTAEIRERRAATLEAGRDLPFVSLSEEFDLDDRQEDALLVALAPELDRRYEKVFAYLQDDIARKRPSVGLVLRVLCDTDRERLGARGIFTGPSPLVDAGLLELSAPDPGTPLLSHAVTVDRRIVEYLLETGTVDPAIADATTVVRPSTGLEDLPVDDPTRRRIERSGPGSGSTAPDEEGPNHKPAMRYVYGPAGVGKDDVVAAMCEGLVDVVVRARGDRLLDRTGTDGLERLLREARLRNAAVHLAGIDRLEREDGNRDPQGRALRILDDHDGPVFLTGSQELTTAPGVTDHEYLAVHVPRPGFRRRAELWERRAGALPDDVAPEEVATKFRLTAGGIDDALATATALSDGTTPSARTLYRACRIQSRRTLGSLARKTDPTHDWSDIVLPDDAMRQLRTVAAHVKHRGQVYSEWGFDERFGRGNGLNVLFTGPSGTGKTMAAEIIANDAGLELFRIDLASVVSKYVGETEENLKQVFDEAEHSDAILFFDEADALFGERSEVSDSHDRYANVEVSYLLQRMEDHDGAVILASNLKDNIDDAFLRRINANVSFPRPDREARAAIWRGIFPGETPVGNLDYEFLSEFEITGGNVKNVALTASFLAADDDEHDRVEMVHVANALRRELQKTGRLVNPDAFGEYRELLE